jgi:hypothetical protein
MTEHQLTDEMVDQFREGCALLAAMTRGEWDKRRSARYRRFQDLDKALTWSLVDVAGPSVFENLDRCPTAWALDWPVAQAWQRALIETSGVAPPPYPAEDDDR